MPLRGLPIVQGDVLFDVTEQSSAILLSLAWNTD